MKILAIETSCDETAVALLECEGDFKKPDITVLGNALLSQVMQHREYGGVYPNLAKRLHSQNLIPMLKEALQAAHEFSELPTPTTYNLESITSILEREPELLKQFETFIPTIKKPDIDAIAVTQGPGLEPALWVGINFARALSEVWDIPLVSVNHMEGHIASVLYGAKNTTVPFPTLALLISGGHTELVLAHTWGAYELIGATRDDAVGEAFDKAARILGLPYPGGPEISTLAEKARNSNTEIQDEIQLPRPMLDSDDFDFSFSGLKTAVLYLTRELGELSDTHKMLLAREFEDAVRDVLVRKTEKALEEHIPKSLIVAGGVIANKTLRNAFTTLAEIHGLPLYIPIPELTTDNAVMIGIAGYFKALREEFASSEEIVADGNLTLA